MSALSLLAAAVFSVQAADTVPTDYEVGGVRVIHLKRASTTDVIAAYVYLLGGARQITPENAGVEPFLLMTSAYGTQSYPGELARRALARTGSRIVVSADADWTSYSLHGVKQEFDSAFAVFADRLMHPTLDSTAIGIVRKRMLAGVARRITSPEDHVEALADSLAFRGHPYAVNPSGNSKSIAALTANDLRTYARDHLVSSRMLIVVVGDISRPQLEQAIGRTLAKLPKGAYAWTLPPPWKASKMEVVAAQRATHTNYIMGYMSGPLRSSPEYPAFERAMNLLSSLVSYEVREKTGLSYAAHVRIVQRGATGAAIYMSTTRPDSAMRVVNRILDVFGTPAMIPRWALIRSARFFNIAYLYGTETASTYAEMLARAQLYEGDYRAAARQTEIMARVAFPGIRRSINEYARNIQFAFVGDTTQIPRKEFSKR